jgi:CheY-like chemotaxis protein
VETKNGLNDNNGMHLLLIDDDTINNFLMSNMLSEISFVKNYSVFTSGHEALEYLKDCSQNQTHIDFIFLDLNMPEMDGFEFLEIFEADLLSYFREIKVAIVTSSNLNKDKAKANNFKSVQYYITKPITEEIVRKIYLNQPLEAEK